MRNLQALMIAADKRPLLLISGSGEVIEPDENFVAIGSGGNYAYSAAHALYKHTNMSAENCIESPLKLLRLYVYTPTITLQ